MRKCFLLIAACGFASPARAADPAEFFEKSVRPVLVEHCLSCHGGKDKVKGGLRLTARAELLKGGDSGPAVEPGKPEKSLLIHAADYRGELRMPPKGKLKDSQIQALTRWVREGAVWPDRGPTTTVSGKSFRITDAQRRHWAYQPVKVVPSPAVKDTAWPKDDIDRFILAGLEAKNLRPAPPAARRTLVRRVTFDLTGLPPTPEELEAALKDQSEDWFAKVVDRLLASPAYGERWGRHWLDNVRYADSIDQRFLGRLNIDITEAWRYRDWVVDAFNRDLPYDRFVLMQIAGDLLPAEGPAGVVATSMLAIGRWEQGEADKEKMMTDIVDDQIDAVSRTFLGLTAACARCHDHKFDPISTADYYGLAGIFFSSHVIPDPGAKAGDTSRLRIPLVSAEEVRKHEGHARQIAELERLIREKTGDPAEHQAALAVLKANTPPPLPAAHGIREGGVPGSAYAGAPRDARIHIRGSYTRLGNVVPRRFPVLFAGENQPRIGPGSGRLELARWIARADHPLTARVMVNRIWQYHFGQGIVRTPSNFGMLGEKPTHPELLDYLADRFVQSGWSVKAMHRLMLRSAAYQQASTATPEALQADPDNRLLGRMNRRRLEAEPLRDSLLSVAGRLDRARGGPAVRSIEIPRRTLYVVTIRSDRSGFGPLFDAADSSALTDRRTVSTVAPQALFLLNHPFALEQTRTLAKRTFPAGDRIEMTYALLYARPPRPVEVRLGEAFLAKSRQDGLTAEQAWEQYVHILICANEFVYVD